MTTIETTHNEVRDLLLVRNWAMSYDPDHQAFYLSPKLSKNWALQWNKLSIKILDIPVYASAIHWPNP